MLSSTLSICNDVLRYVQPSRTWAFFCHVGLAPGRLCVPLATAALSPKVKRIFEESLDVLMAIFRGINEQSKLNKQELRRIRHLLANDRAALKMDLRHNVEHFEELSSRFSSWFGANTARIAVVSERGQSLSRLAELKESANRFAYFALDVLDYLVETSDSLIYYTTEKGHRPSTPSAVCDILVSGAKRLRAGTAGFLLDKL